MPRRASRPLGSVRHIDGDRWEMRYRGASKTVRAKTRLEARKALARWIDTVSPERAGETLTAICEQWLNASKNRKEARTVEEQERLIRLHIAPSKVGAMNAGAVRSHHLEDFYDLLASTPRTTRRGPWTARIADSAGADGRNAVSPLTPSAWRATTASGNTSSTGKGTPTPVPLSGGTIKHIHDVINASYRWAQRRGVVDRNPAAGASERPSLNRRHIDIPDLAQLQAILTELDADDDKRFVMFVRLALVTGARRGELIGLRWGDVGDDGILRLRRAVSEPDAGNVLIKDTKTALSRRAVALDETTVRALHVYRAWLEEKRLSSAWLFPDLIHPDLPDRPSRYSAKWIRTAGKAGIRLHDLRHLVASLLLNAGVPVAEVSAQLGHARRSTTMDIYSHLIGDRAQERVDIIAGVLERQQELPRGEG